MKNAPSQTAQYETPRPWNSVSPGTSSFVGSPPTVTITVYARWTVPSSMTTTFQSPSLRIFFTGEYGLISRPNFFACAAIFSAISRPVMDSSPGQSSMRSVFRSSPPTSLASNSTECMFARAAYRPAVRPAGPPPMMIRS